MITMYSTSARTFYPRIYTFSSILLRMSLSTLRQWVLFRGGRAAARHSTNHKITPESLILILLFISILLSISIFSIHVFPLHCFCYTKSPVHVGCVKIQPLRKTLLGLKRQAINYFVFAFFPMYCKDSLEWAMALLNVIPRRWLYRFCKAWCIQIFLLSCIIYLTLSWVVQTEFEGTWLSLKN